MTLPVKLESSATIVKAKITKVDVVASQNNPRIKGDDFVVSIVLESFSLFCVGCRTKSGLITSGLHCTTDQHNDHTYFREA